MVLTSIPIFKFIFVLFVKGCFLLTLKFYFFLSVGLLIASDGIQAIAEETFCSPCINGIKKHHLEPVSHFWHHKYLQMDGYLVSPDALSGHESKWSIYKMLYFILIVIIMLVGLLSTAGLGCMVALHVFVKSGKKYQPKPELPQRLKALYTLKKQVNLKNPLEGFCSCSATHPLCCCQPSHASESSTLTPAGPVNAALHHLLDRALSAAVLPWYSQLVTHPKPALDEIRACGEFVLQRICTRVSSMDAVGFLTGGVAIELTKHLQKIRQAQMMGEKTGERGVFHLVPQLSSPERERNFLRRLSEFLLLHTLPPQYYACTPLRCVLREALACTVLEACVDRVCSPDWINQQIVQHLKVPSSKPEADGGSHHPASAGGYRHFCALLTDAPHLRGGHTMEDLLRAIHCCDDEERLEKTRQVLHQELLLCSSAAAEAACAADVDPSVECGPLDSRAPPVYGEGGEEVCVSHLARARAECERRLLAVKAGLIDADSGCEQLPAASFSSVLESSVCRRYLHNYLQSLQAPLQAQESLASVTSSRDKPLVKTDSEPSNSSPTSINSTSRQASEELRSSQDSPPSEKGSNLTVCSGVAALGLYCCLLELLGAPARQREHLRQEIYFMFFSDGCTHPVPIDEVVRRHIWQLVQAGATRVVSTAQGPLVGCLAGAVEEVGQFLQTRYSAGFLHSSHYKEMVREVQAIGHSFNGSADTESSIFSSDVPSGVSQQLQHALSSLALHQEKALYKSWALQSVPASEKLLVENCKRELREAESAVKSYDAHVRSLQLWLANLGKWRVHVQSVEYTDDKDNPELVLLVSLEDEASPAQPLQKEKSQPAMNILDRFKSATVSSDSSGNSNPPTTLLISSAISEDSTSPSSSLDSDKSLCANNNDVLSSIKYKSRSFEKDSGSAQSTNSDAKLSSCGNKQQGMAEKSKSLSEKHLGALKGEKANETLRSRSATTGSLERILGTLTKSSSAGTGVSRPNEDMDGWVVVRKLSHFTELHKKLCAEWPSLKAREVPSLPSKSLFSKSSSNSERACCERLRASAQRYLAALTWDALDPAPARSLAFLEFVCPTQRLLLRPPQQHAKKYKFSLSSFFKGREGKGESDEEDINSGTESFGRRLASFVESEAAVERQKAENPATADAPQLDASADAKASKESAVLQCQGPEKTEESGERSDLSITSYIASKLKKDKEKNPRDRCPSGSEKREKTPTRAGGPKAIGEEETKAPDAERLSAPATSVPVESPSSATPAAAAGGGGGSAGAVAVSEAVVAEPLFALLEELCELRGRGRWLRKTLVSFVQITYGKNITRHVRETASALLTEEKVVGYINALHSLWDEREAEELPSDGPKAALHRGKGVKSPQRSTKEKSTSSTAAPTRTHKQVLETRQEARAAVLQTLPDLLGKLVGQQNAVRGAQRLFVVLQHHALNKNLFYNLLEELLQELFPDLRQRLEKIKARQSH